MSKKAAVRMSASIRALPPRPLWRVLAVVVLLGLPGVAGVVPSAAGPASSGANAARAGGGLAPLAEVSGLDDLAARHAQAMAARGSMYHMSSLSDAVARVVPNWTRVGQNVGTGASIEEIEAPVPTF